MNSALKEDREISLEVKRRGILAQVFSEGGAPVCPYRHPFLARASRVRFSGSSNYLLLYLWKPFDELEQFAIEINGFKCIPPGKKVANLLGYKGWNSNQSNGVGWWLQKSGFEPIVLPHYGNKKRRFWRICCIRDAMMRRAMSGPSYVGLHKQLWKERKEAEIQALLKREREAARQNAETESEVGLNGLAER